MAGALESDIELAHELATIAARAAIPFVADAVLHDAKPDGTPVSQADWAAEAAMLDHLRRYRPDDGILSEESGKVAEGRRRWLLDPIDGTAEFVTGGMEWGTHVALEVAGEIVLGIITRPLIGRRWWAARGHGAFSDTENAPCAGSRRLRVSTTDSLGDARIGLYCAGASPVLQVLGDRCVSVAVRGSHTLDLVEGRIDAVVSDRCGFIWDHAPGVILVMESGGRFTDPTGGTRADQQGGLYTNGHMHGQLLDAVSGGGIELGGRCF